MKMKKIMIYMFLLTMGGSAVFTGCKKDTTEETTPTPDSDTQTAQDNAIAEGTFNDVNNIANEAVENGDSLSSYRLINGESSLLSHCATVTLTLNTPPTPGGTIVVDFGPSFCQCHDGRFRKGIINIAFTGMYRDSGSVITVTFNNYYVGKNTTTQFYKVMGTKTVTNTGHNAAGHTVFNINVTSGSLTNPSGQTMTWNSTRQREWTAGESTPNWLDDQYMISGSINGTNFLGNSFTIVITQPLHIDFTCPYIKDGKFEFTPSGRPTRYVDYSYPLGGCDAQAKVTINGYVFYINLP